jgi:pyruvate dehydrogenase complex dehydrogenase (E1) component
MLEDLDPAETREWRKALDSVLAYELTCGFTCVAPPGGWAV